MFLFLNLFFLLVFVLDLAVAVMGFVSLTASTAKRVAIPVFVPDEAIKVVPATIIAAIALQTPQHIVPDIVVEMEQHPRTHAVHQTAASIP